MIKKINNDDYYDLIINAINGDKISKFMIIEIFSDFTKYETAKLGVLQDECIDYVEEKIFKNIEKFKKYLKNS